MMSFDTKPKGKEHDLVVQELDGELLIYDLQSNKAYCLNETAARIFKSCDGKTSLGDMIMQIGDEDLVWLGLNDLRKQKLIEHDLPTPAKFEGMSRRTVVKHIGLSSLLAVPVIASMVAPAAAQAGTVCGIPCSNSSTCMVPGSACGNCGPDMSCAT
jgi:hypothetical protein